MKNRASIPFLMLGLLVACSSAPVETTMDTQEEKTSYHYVQLAPTPPPAPQEEIAPELQDPMNQVWRKGYWSYNGTFYTWVPGNIMQRPSPTAAWSHDRWEKRKFGWAFVPGYWF